MKIELDQLKYATLKDFRFLFVYGNLPELADIIYLEFLRFLKEIGCVASGTCIGCSDFLKNVSSQQENLFCTAQRVFRITGVQDNNVELFLKKIADENSAIYVITPGEYKKSKGVSDVIFKRREWLSLPSFKNKLTYAAICRTFIKAASNNDINMITGVLERSDEDLTSAVTKLTLLYEKDKDAIQRYVVESSNWVFDMQPIALLRFISSMCLNGNSDRLSEILFGKSVILNGNSVLEYCINTELRVKNGVSLTNDVILNDILLGNVL